MSVSWRKGEKKIYNSNGKIQDIDGWYHTAWVYPGIWSSGMHSTCIVVIRWGKTWHAKLCACVCLAFPWDMQVGRESSAVLSGPLSR